MYILNELDLIRELLISKSKPKEMSVSYLACLIAKYYLHSCNAADELSDMVKGKLCEFSIPGYQEYRYHKKISSICSGLFSGSISRDFREDDYIPIYESEIAAVGAIPSDRLRKLMFTLYAVARYMDCEGWINKKTSGGISEIFRLANISATSMQKCEMLNLLYTGGYISFAKRIDNLNICVRMGFPGDVAYKIRNFSDIGNQYIGNFKNGYMQCVRCGRAVRVTGRRQKYCPRCAAEVQSAQKKTWDSERRNG